MLRKANCDVSLGVDSYEKGAYNTAAEEARSTVPIDTIASKLKSHCPSLYYSLSTWERDSLDPSNVLEADTSPTTLSGDRTVSAREGLNTLGVDSSYPGGGRF